MNEFCGYNKFTGNEIIKPYYVVGKYHRMLIFMIRILKVKLNLEEFVFCIYERIISEVFFFYLFLNQEI